jgi:hypothetical protein
MHSPRSCGINLLTTRVGRVDSKTAFPRLSGSWSILQTRRVASHRGLRGHKTMEYLSNSLSCWCGSQRWPLSWDEITITFGVLIKRSALRIGENMNQSILPRWWIFSIQTIDSCEYPGNSIGLNSGKRGGEFGNVWHRGQ